MDQLEFGWNFRTKAAVFIGVFAALFSFWVAGEVQREQTFQQRKLQVAVRSKSALPAEQVTYNDIAVDWKHVVQQTFLPLLAIAAFGSAVAFFALLGPLKSGVTEGGVLFAAALILAMECYMGSALMSMLMRGAR